jgi:predicted RNA binding protein YcfA (HicA-like mRNA interferase family)
MPVFTTYIHKPEGLMSLEHNSRAIIRRLEAEGWVLVSSRGSHHKFRKGEVTLVVPHPKKDLPIGTARNIAQVAGWLRETP